MTDKIKSVLQYMDRQNPLVYAIYLYLLSMCLTMATYTIHMVRGDVPKNETRIRIETETKYDNSTVINIHGNIINIGK